MGRQGRGWGWGAEEGFFQALIKTKAADIDCAEKATVYLSGPEGQTCRKQFASFTPSAYINIIALLVHAMASGTVHPQ